MNKTIVTPEDFESIKESFTAEEIKDKYGRLKVMSEHEYQAIKLREKMKNRLRKEGRYYGE